MLGGPHVAFGYGCAIFGSSIRVSDAPRPGRSYRVSIEQVARRLDPRLFQYWPTAYGAGPTLKQHWFKSSCLLGWHWWDLFWIRMCGSLCRTRSKIARSSPTSTQLPAPGLVYTSRQIVTHTLKRDP